MAIQERSGGDCLVLKTQEALMPGHSERLELTDNQANNNSYRTPTEHWQKTSDFPKGKKLPMYLGRAKEKRKNRG